MFSRCSITFAANVCQCEWWQRPWRAWLMHFLAWGTSEKLERTSRKSLPRLEDECLWTILRDQAGIHTGYCTFTYFYYKVCFSKENPRSTLFKIKTVWFVVSVLFFHSSGLWLENRKPHLLCSSTFSLNMGDGSFFAFQYLRLKFSVF